MRNAFVVAGAVLLTAAGQTRGFAQAVHVGERVRLTPRAESAQRLVGTVTAVRGDTIFVARDSTESAPAWVVSSQLRSVEHSVGRRRQVGKGMLIGSGVGALVGAVMGAASYERPSGSDWLCQPATEACVFLDFDFGPGFYVASGAAIGAIAGFVVGGVIGAANTTDRWQRATQSLGLGDVRVGPSGRGARAALSWSFGAPSRR